MLIIKEILEEDHILFYLNKRNLVNQYKKSKINILTGNFSGNKIGYKEPKKDEIVYFRINKQFRALCRLDGKKLIVFDIDNHQ